VPQVECVPQVYQGQELDSEVGGAGFYAFELRQYDARLGKWLSADPYRQHWSPYLAMANNPISFIDPDGGWSVNPVEQGEIGDPWYANDATTFMIDGMIAAEYEMRMYGNETVDYYGGLNAGSWANRQGEVFLLGKK
jgi:RHS repeat-associated protein